VRATIIKKSPLGDLGVKKTAQIHLIRLAIPVLKPTI